MLYLKIKISFCLIIKIIFTFVLDFSYMSHFVICNCLYRRSERLGSMIFWQPTKSVGSNVDIGKPVPIPIPNVRKHIKDCKMKQTSTKNQTSANYLQVQPDLFKKIRKTQVKTINKNNYQGYRLNTSSLASFMMRMFCCCSNC